MPKSAFSSTIQAAQILQASASNGPGLRSVLWVQGCPFRCEGCWNPAMLPFQGGQELSVDEVFSRLTASKDIEGVTFLGGEPFAQAGPLAEIAGMLKSQGLGIIAYSGWTREQLEAGNHVQRALLDECDLLVDGLYRQEEAGELLWRGSRNQRLHFLTPRYEAWRGMDEKAYRHFEAFIDAEGGMILTGDPDTGLFNSLSGAQVHG